MMRTQILKFRKKKNYIEDKKKMALEMSRKIWELIVS